MISCNLMLHLIFIYTGLFSPDTMRLHLALISDTYLFRRFAISYLIHIFDLINALDGITNLIYRSAQFFFSHQFYSYTMILSSSHFTPNSFPHINSAFNRLHPYPHPHPISPVLFRSDTFYL